MLKTNFESADGPGISKFKKVGRFFQIFVVFSEYYLNLKPMNFNNVSDSKSDFDSKSNVIFFDRSIGHL